MQQLPQYKQEFLEQKDQNQQQNNLVQVQYETEQMNLNPTHQSRILNNKLYQGEWREEINKTYYREKHNESEFVDADTLNPEILERRFNMRHTKISEYSNAVYNGSVFINPKFTSC